MYEAFRPQCRISKNLFVCSGKLSRTSQSTFVAIIRTAHTSLSLACLQEKVERRPGAESQYGFDNIYASWRDAPPVQDWYQGREDGSAATPAADIARPSEELQNAAVASIGVRPGQDKDASEPLSFDELLRIDTKTLTRKEKLDMEAHLSSSEKLALRKARISLQMKGRRPWNTGRSHPEGTSLLTQAHFCHFSNLKYLHLIQFWAASFG